MDEDWQVMTSVSLPKPLMEILKLKESGPSISTILENVPTSTNSNRAKTVVDRLELPTQVKKVLFKCDCEEIPLSENQMGYISDLETLEWFWDIVKEEEFQRMKEVTLPSPFETLAMKTLSKKVSCWFIKSRKQRETFQMLMFLRADGPRFLKQWVQTKKSVLRLRRIPKNHSFF